MENSFSALLQITPLVTFFAMQEELRDRAVMLGQGEFSYSNLRYSSKHSAPMVLVNSIPDIVHEYVELFFRSETLQMYCLKWAHLLKKLLLGYNPMDELKEAARKVCCMRNRGMNAYRGCHLISRLLLMCLFVGVSGCSVPRPHRLREIAAR